MDATPSGDIRVFVGLTIVPRTATSIGCPSRRNSPDSEAHGNAAEHEQLLGDRIHPHRKCYRQ